MDVASHFSFQRKWICDVKLCEEREQKSPPIQYLSYQTAENNFIFPRRCLHTLHSLGVTSLPLPVCMCVRAIHTTVTIFGGKEKICKKRETKPSNQIISSLSFSAFFFHPVLAHNSCYTSCLSYTGFWNVSCPCLRNRATFFPSILPKSQKKGKIKKPQPFGGKVLPSAPKRALGTCRTVQITFGTLVWLCELWS